jgi:Helix-turn-helix domain
MPDTFFTPPEVAKRFRVNADKILGFIRRGELRAMNVAANLSGRPRYRIALADVQAFETRRQAGSVPVTRRRGPKTEIARTWF